MYHGCHVIVPRGRSRDDDPSRPQKRGRRRERKELNGKSEGNRGTRLDISIQKLLWQPGRSECSPIISILGRGRAEKRGAQKKRKMGLTFRPVGLREVTSSRPFQDTWPPAVWWTMEPQMGRRGRDPGRIAWEPAPLGKRESSSWLNKRSQIKDALWAGPYGVTVLCPKKITKLILPAERNDSLQFHPFSPRFTEKAEEKRPECLLQMWWKPLETLLTGLTFGLN